MNFKRAFKDLPCFLCIKFSLILVGITKFANYVNIQELTAAVAALGMSQLSVTSSAGQFTLH